MTQTISGTFTHGVSLASSLGTVTATTTITSNDKGTYGAASSADGVYSNVVGATLVNDGQIAVTGLYGYGIYLTQGGGVTNGSSTGSTASSSGYHDGIFLKNGSGSILNQGTVTANATNGSAVLLLDETAGSVSNYGLLQGAVAGVELIRAPGTINNQGSITADGQFRAYPDGIGIEILHGAATITNGSAGNSSATIYGSYGGISLSDGAGVVTNFGTITGGSRFGIELLTGGTIINHGVISSGDFGGYVYDAAGTVINDGTFASGFGATGLALGFQSTPDRLIVDPGAVFVGTVAAYAGGTLELAGTGGTISGIGTSFSGFGVVTVDAGASWYIGLASASSFAGTLSGLSSADTLSLAGITGVTSTDILAGNTLQISRAAGGPIDLQLDPTQNFSGYFFHHTQIGGNTQITEDTVPCFCAGTTILTETGDALVETIVPGDTVITLRDGKTVSRTVRWVGQRRIDLRRHRAPHLAQPIRICRDAFAEGQPHRDLLVSPDHAVFVDGMLIVARMLVNGMTILREDRLASVHYFHVELDTHSIVLAEGLPVETYLDTGNRGLFANAGGPLILHPDLTNDQRWREAESCAPFVADATRVAPIWRRLAQRAALLGYVPSDGRDVTHDPDPRIFVDGRCLRPITADRGRYVFVLPPTSGAVRLVSRTSVPTDARPWIDDRRRLGVMVTRLALASGDSVDAIPLDDPRLGDGWWEVEWHGTTWPRRWTNGDAILPVKPRQLALLEIELTSALVYPLDHQVATVPRRMAA